MPLISAALEAIEITSTDELFCIADYGTADGGTSMPVIINCIKTLRDKYGDSLPINIVYEDRPTNDFKSLFLRVNGMPSLLQLLFFMLMGLKPRLCFSSSFCL